MTDPCFHMGCVEWIGSDTCGECGRWTGTKTALERDRKAHIEDACDESWERSSERGPG